MLGSEYNWLIRLTRPAAGTARVDLAQGGLLTLAVAVFCLLCIAASPESAKPAAAKPSPSAVAIPAPATH